MLSHIHLSADLHTKPHVPYLERGDSGCSGWVALTLSPISHTCVSCCFWYFTWTMDAPLPSPPPTNIAFHQEAHLPTPYHKKKKKCTPLYQEGSVVSRWPPGERIVFVPVHSFVPQKNTSCVVPCFFNLCVCVYVCVLSCIIVAALNTFSGQLVVQMCR